jgi:hypothetical protein
VRYLGQLVQLLQQLLPRITGSFTMTATATKAVADPRIQAGAIVQLIPTNAAAGTMQGSSKYLFAVVSPGVGFTATTSDGTNGSATATFSYLAVNPV